MPISPLLGLPSIPSPSVASSGYLSKGGPLQYLPGGAIIDGTKARDPGNSAYSINVLRTGLLMGKATSGGKYANSVIGVTGGALTGAGTSITVAAAVATEISRRLGASGTLKLTGPATANGTARTLTATYSAVGATTVTITALGVADVWTLTAPAGQDAGYYQLEVTTGKGTSAETTETTAALAANANSATVDAALEALTNVGASGVAAVYADPTLTLTFASNLGPVHVRVLSDTTNDGGVFEGGWAAVHTTTGVDGRFVAGSLIQPVDGTETPITLIADAGGVIIPDDSGDVYFARLPIGGVIDQSVIVNWPSDTGIRAYLRAALSTASGGKFVFPDQY